MVNGTPIEFSERINQILVKDMENIVVLKLLRCNIGFTMLQNKIYNLWKSGSQFHLKESRMVIFWLDFKPNSIMKRYLTVQPWSVSINSTQAFPSTVMSWIILPRFLGYFYKRKILTEIGGMIGKIAKLDMNNDNKVKGWFACMVDVNLDAPLISHVLVNGKVQRV